METQKNNNHNTHYYVWDRHYSRRRHERRNVYYLAYPVEKERRVIPDRRVGLYDRRKTLA